MVRQKVCDQNWRIYLDIYKWAYFYETPSQSISRQIWRALTWWRSIICRKLTSNKAKTRRYSPQSRSSNFPVSMDTASTHGCPDFNPSGSFTDRCTSFPKPTPADVRRVAAVDGTVSAGDGPSRREGEWLAYIQAQIRFNITSEWKVSETVTWH